MRPSVEDASQAVPRDLRVEGHLEGLAFLGESIVLALVTGIAIDASESMHAVLVAAEGTQRLAGGAIPIDPARRSSLVVLRTAAPGEALLSTGRLVLQAKSGAVALEPSEIGRARGSIGDFGQLHLGGLPAERRAMILGEILTLVRGEAGTLADAAPDLAELREAIRPRFPGVEIRPSGDFAAHVDALWRVDERSFYVEGWLWDRGSRLTTLSLLSPEGRHVDVFGDAFRYDRADASEVFGAPANEKLGFIAFVELPEESLLHDGWILQAQRSDRMELEVELPRVLDHPRDLRSTILVDMDLDPAPDRRLLREHISPAIARLERRIAAGVAIDAIDQHGEPPAAPEVSIIVPLYRRTEFLEYQLAQFVHDPQIAASDLIYVLDSPDDAAQLRTSAGQLFELYGVPFRLVTLTGNGGFSAVNNLGASLARGRMLLLLNSDVLPAAPGWLSRMVEFYESDEIIGAVGPKLLYEDESIQHAGLYFDRPAGPGPWSNEHFFKGLHRSFPAANVARAVPALTGACLLISGELYAALGGLRGVYVRGDYEDSDLCLRLREHRRECWYLPHVELYHLEGQSYPSSERSAASSYNQWLHTDIWHEALTEIGGQP